jgi:hypothetical protein
MTQAATILMLTLFSLPLSRGSEHQLTKTGGEVDNTRQRLASVEEQVAGLRKASPPQSFLDASASIESITFTSGRPALPPESDTTKSLSKIWVEYLAKLDGALSEANKDFKLPVTKVFPGEDSDGTVYMPGVSPDMIKDPEVRKRYLDDIAENEKRREKAFVIHDISNLNLKVWAEFQTWLCGNYRHNAQEISEIRVLAQQQSFSKPPLEKLNQILAKMSQP